jgi:DNA topoisomerase-1
MGKSLVIVESPAKAKTINKYLGSGYVVKSSVGHIRDLPSGGGIQGDAKERAEKAAKTRQIPASQKAEHKASRARSQLFNRMGIDPEHHWAARYEIMPGKEKVIEDLRKAAKDADHIYLATDLDREGEAIAWHLQEVIGGDHHRYSRVIFNEITQKAIQEAFSRPCELDMSRVNAQQARRFLDRVVGFMVSPLLWAKVARGLSAGRVQSPAVRLIVDREREIRAFVPEEYWEIAADLVSGQCGKFSCDVVRHGEKNFRPLNKADADTALQALQQASYIVSAREDKPTQSKPSAPFITSTLQQAASTRLGFGVKKTMMLAQRLYEAGYITYMRTDSTSLSTDAVNACRDYIEKQYGKNYLPHAPNTYTSKKGAQEAHEAIRPSDISVSSSQLKGLPDRDAERLYDLIWRQFVACQMTPAQYLATRIDIAAGDYELRARGRVLRFDGFTRVLASTAKNDGEHDVPDIKVGENLKLDKLHPSQHFTSPPSRYSEAGLVKELEKCGIGRPSTYASIISTIQERGYVTVQNRRFYANKIGDIVTDRLRESFDDLMDYNFTADMEVTLDEIAEGKKNWIDTLDSFYSGFTRRLEKAQNEVTGMRSNEPTATNIPCPACGRAMQIRTGSTGVFLGCSGYALPPKERCKTTINLVPGNEVAVESHEPGDGDDAPQEAEARLLLNRHRCPKCSTSMDSYLIDEKRKLHVCGNNPDCDGYEIEIGSFKIKGYDGPLIECDKCGSDMQLKTGRFGKYFGCTNTACKNTRKLLRSGEAAPPKMNPVACPELRCVKVDDFYLLRDGAAGLFLAASQFPKFRETRPPFIDELLPHKGEIDSKYHYLFSAPAKDPQGNRTLVRFSRKNKEQYVLSEIDGKPTGWKVNYRNGKWKEE